ncbi:MAG TPA: M23 family metallopeptidase [Sphingomicrobium sp.]|nr:M23 family metallopeptidase [Sphingomicrobium sp.]
MFTAVFTAVVVSAFWIWFYSIVPEPRAQVERSGTIVSVKPDKSAPVEFAQQVVVGPAGLAIPVVGVKASDLVDTFDAARSAGRRHDAIDIMAAEGTPVIAAADGTIEKLFYSNGGGGITIYERSADPKWQYYYAHLSAYAPGLSEGQQVRRGQVIARVGHTGDASASGPHLHFAVNAIGPGQRWWQGTPINPFPILGGRKG